ncbi:hypothetical protein [Pseudorhizobium pelagicum]|uniref:hypothetical protein n=1 Tax=Pseudorhizobium pelagicum TaxID=1509405 RepID=UPI001300C91E|nr:hypothetical protein [Pseudorhizobium pelagicum]
MMNHDREPAVQDAKNALARDITRFKTLYPNGEAKLKVDPTKHFAYLNSAEMVATAS